MEKSIIDKAELLKTLGRYDIRISTANTIAGSAMQIAKEALYHRTDIYRHELKKHVRMAMKEYIACERSKIWNYGKMTNAHLDYLSAIDDTMNEDIHMLIDAAIKRVERYGLPNADIIAKMEIARVMISSAILTKGHIIDTAPFDIRWRLSSFFAPMSMSRVQVNWDNACKRLYDLECDAVDFNEEEACTDVMEIINAKLGDSRIINRALYEAVCLNRKQAEERLGMDKLAILDKKYGGTHA